MVARMINAVQALFLQNYGQLFMVSRFLVLGVLILSTVQTIQIFPKLNRKYVHLKNYKEIIFDRRKNCQLKKKPFLDFIDTFLKRKYHLTLTTLACFQCEFI